ncbi:MAG: 2-phospho-L-lactate transferase CofD family protein [Candidatus Aenigmatarchaeota archaeon]
MKVVGLGGGSGTTSIVGLRNLGYDLTLIVSVVDDGGSSGVLRRANPDIIPPGDIRKPALYSSTLRETLETRLGDIRINRTDDLGKILDYYPHSMEISSKIKPYDILDIPLGIDTLRGHNLGNLILTAMMLKFGNIEGIRNFLELVDCEIGILPASEKPSTFCFMSQNSQKPEIGENLLDDFQRRSEPIVNCWLFPEVDPYQRCIERIGEADFVVISPTSIYANIVSILLIPGYQEALREKRIIWAGNIMTEWNQTAFTEYSLTGRGHLEVLRRYLGRYPDYAVVPKLKGQTLGEVFGAYEGEGASPVLYRRRDFEEVGVGYKEVNMVRVVEIEHRGQRLRVLRHDPESLAKSLDEIIKSYT